MVVFVPHEFVVDKETVTEPAVLNETVGDELFDVAGEPPGKVQLKLAASVELLPSNWTIVGQATVLSTNSIEATLGLFTLIVIVVELLQLPVVPVIEYVVETVGFAVTLLPVVVDNPVAGDQVSEPAPVAVNAVLSPLQIVLFPLTPIDGVGLTVITTKAESNKEQPPPIVYKIAL